ncbi:hypothetical protein JOC54_003126 [Alkalihalobacillus xiaoxiensis]|uniref:Holin-like toxin n=1 Tax=Shouchella xiaoxiensis TaxID=766895 RepID=A0ABS2SXU7_9BACI|nr:hypothetical protein [Shouchella xiaoxiensis]
MSIYEAMSLVITVGFSTGMFIIGLITLILLLRNDK